MSLLLLAALPAGLTLHIASPQKAVLVGEPVKVVVTWRAARAIDDRLFHENERFTNQSLVFRTRKAWCDVWKLWRAEEQIDHLLGSTEGPLSTSRHFPGPVGGRLLSP